jgi:hypothetical protein
VLDFVLVDQNNRCVRVSSFRVDVLVVTFVQDRSVSEARIGPYAKPQNIGRQMTLEDC